MTEDNIDNKFTGLSVKEFVQKVKELKKEEAILDLSMRKFKQGIERLREYDRQLRRNKLLGIKASN